MSLGVFFCFPDLFLLHIPFAETIVFFLRKRLPWLMSGRPECVELRIGEIQLTHFPPKAHIHSFVSPGYVRILLLLFVLPVSAPRKDIERTRLFKNL
jgi:hypothetical protein